MYAADVIRCSAAQIDDYMDKRGEYEPFFGVCFKTFLESYF